MPELYLLLLGERTRVSNDRCFFLHDGINLAGELYHWCRVAAYVGVVTLLPWFDIDERHSFIS